MRLLLFTLLFSSFVHSQKFDGYVVTNANDTIRCKFFVRINSINENSIYPSSVCKKVKILTGKGEEITYKPLEIKSFYFIGPECDFKFVSLKEDKKQFYHEVTLGKINLYKIYFSSTGMEFSNGVILSNGKLHTIAGFGLRKKFGEFIKDYPELYNKWMNTDEYKLNQFTELVFLYNDHFKNKL